MNPETAIAKKEKVYLSICPHPFYMRRDSMVVLPGTSVAELMEMADFQPSPFTNTKVFINDRIIPKEDWQTICPRDGDIVSFRVIPFGGGKNIFRLILGLAVMAFAWWAAPILGPMIGITSTLGIGLLTGAIGLMGNLLLNAIFPPSQMSLSGRKSQDLGKSENYSLNSARNRVNPFGVIPQILGTRKIVPPMGALPYTEVQGDDQYMRLLFLIGYGPASITSLKIGEKDVDDYDDVEYEIRQGFDDDEPLTLYNNDIYEEALSYELTQATGWVSDTTQANADEFSYDITFPNGLVRYDDLGEKHALYVNFEVEVSPTGEEDWTLISTPSRKAKELKLLRLSEKILLPEKGQWDVRIRRLTEDYTDEQYIHATYWTSLRSITYDEPISETGLAKVAMRIKASGQFNNIVDEFNCVASSIVNDWDGEAWTEQASNNPASLFRHVLQGAANKRPLTDAQIDTTALQTWAENCDTNSYAFNEYVDYQTSVNDILGLIAAAGRASPTYKDGDYSVIEDTTGKTPIQHFSPRNSWGFSGNKTYYHPPHAVRVRFLNEDENYLEDERIVYDDGYTSENATDFETLELPGITDPELIWKHARYHMAVGKYRSEQYIFNADVENLVCTRGDLVRFSHDVIMSSVAVGRVKEVTVNEGGDILTATMDEAMPMEVGETYAIRFRLKTGATNIQVVTTEPVRADERVITFTTPIATNKPEVGDLGLFGLTNEESMEILIKSIKPTNDLTATITAVDYASATALVADQGEVPAYTSGLNPVVTIPTPDIDYVRSNEYAMLRSSDGSLVPRILVGLVPLSSKQLAIVSSMECQVRLTS